MYQIVPTISSLFFSNRVSSACLCTRGSAYSTRFVPVVGKAICAVGIRVIDAVFPPEYEVRLEEASGFWPSYKLITRAAFTPIPGTIMWVELESSYKVDEAVPVVVVVHHKAGHVDSQHCATFEVGRGQGSGLTGVSVLADYWKKVEGVYPSAILKYTDGTCSRAYFEMSDYVSSSVVESKTVCPFTRNVTGVVVDGDFVAGKTVLVDLLDSNLQVVESKTLYTNDLPLLGKQGVVIPLDYVLPAVKGETLFVRVRSGGVGVSHMGFSTGAARSAFIPNLCCSQDGMAIEHEIVWVYPQFEGVRPPLFPCLNIGEEQ